MKIKELILQTTNVEAEKDFYSDVLGFPIKQASQTHFTIKVGWTLLTFKYASKAQNYHYCFLIPANKLQEAVVWLETRMDIIKISETKKTVHFKDWNAESVYFYDASGNVVEFIIRHDLNNFTDDNFNINQIICVHEIGMPTTNISAINCQLETTLGTNFWKGDLKRFGVHGDLEGIFLLPNYNFKTTWFPTEVAVLPVTFQAAVKTNKGHFEVQFENEKLKITKRGW
ncbi:VOC family protein [Aquimarina agarivorans]|uniref:VOC family protein n=1 Tax=Aquimarina agarivorans TaxID=980584 RepID=UPI000248EC0D|nr:glyoxalase [Aquimarina agarivorans]